MSKCTNFDIMWQLGSFCPYDCRVWELLQATAKKIYSARGDDGFYLSNTTVLSFIPVMTSQGDVALNPAWLELLALWNEFPQMRFWQFIVNIFGSSLTQKLPEGTIVSDTEVLNTVRNTVNRWKGKKDV